VAALPLKASDYIRRAVKFTPFPGEDVGRMIKDAGAELFLFSSDYPHPEGTDDPIGRFERTFSGLTEDEKEKFYYSNFQEMMAPPECQAKQCHQQIYMGSSFIRTLAPAVGVLRRHRWRTMPIAERLDGSSRRSRP
jgi:hypothetical protein